MIENESKSRRVLARPQRMKEPGYDVAVTWRVYPKVSASSPPPIFGDDKLKLSELCLRSFKDSIGDLRVKLWAVLNSCPPEYEEMFYRVWGKENLVIVRLPGVPASASLYEAIQILTRQADAEVIFLACDDYFYLPGQFRAAVNFIRQNPDADFVTVYDHLELHTTDLHRLQCETRKAGDRTWMTCVSTTDTYMTTRKTLTELHPFFLRLKKSFASGHWPDLGTWMALTKKRVFNPFKLVQWSFNRRYWAFSIVLGWVYCWRQVLFGRRYKLWGPQPSIATHMVAGLEAPGIDWQKEFERQLPELSTR
jgi:hypothetical protein